MKMKSEPIVICGCGRSGTSLLLSILSAHPKIYAFPFESQVLMHELRYSRWLTRLNNFRKLLVYARDIKPTADRWCEKSPRNIRFLDSIDSTYNSEVRIIHIIRDGRDVICSKHPSNNEYWINKDRWVSDVKAGLRFSSRKNVLNIKYEELIADFENQIVRLFAFLGEDLVDEVLNYHHYADVKRFNAFHHNNVVQSIYVDSIGKWHKPEYSERVEKAMQDHEFTHLLSELGYI
jgi:hypothetical protein